MTPRIPGTLADERLRRDFKAVFHANPLWIIQGLAPALGGTMTVMPTGKVGKHMPRGPHQHTSPPTSDSVGIAESELSLSLVFAPSPD